MMQEYSVTSAPIQAVLDHAPVAAIVSGLDRGELLYANPAAHELLTSCRPNHPELRSHPTVLEYLSSFCAAEHAAAPQPPVREVYHPESGRTYRLNGTQIDWNGEAASLTYLLDRTEQTKTRSETFLTWQLETFRSLPCGLCVYRIEEGHIRPLFHNPAFFEILGYSRDHIAEIQQEMRYTGVHPEDLPPLESKLARLIQDGTVLRHTLRIFNDKLQNYRWIRVDGSMKRQADGAKYLYVIYSDVSEQVRLETDLAQAREKMQDIINAIPGGVAIYRVSDRFETVYFSDGVPELTGYTAEEYQKLIQGDAVEMTYWEDTQMIVSKAQKVIRTHQTDSFEFRKLHRDGRIIWVRIQVKWMGEERGFPLLHCVFHNITDLKETQLSLEHLIHTIPGGIASYQVEEGRFRALFLSDGIIELSGYDRETYQALTQNDALDLIFEPDRARVYQFAQAALKSGAALCVSCRIRCKDGRLRWIHLNGRRIGPLTELPRLHVVCTGMSAEAKLFQSIANETADGIYVVNQETYDLLYANESSNFTAQERDCMGRKCYEVMRGNQEPCQGCPLCDAASGSYDLTVEEHGRFYHTRFRQTDWNGIGAYIIYIRDRTDEVRTRQEKEKLEVYFQTLVKNLPGGVLVVQYEKGGHLIPEFMSDGFFTMTGMPMKESWRLYGQDAMNGVHAEDRARVIAQMEAFIDSGDSHCELFYRLQKGADTYILVKNALSLIRTEDGKCQLYCSLHDITREWEEQERIRQQYKELILQHYRTPDPNALIIGHCNVTRNQTVEMVDRTNLGLLHSFGPDQDGLFRGLSSYIMDAEEREAFLKIFRNAPSLAAFHRKETEQILNCVMQFPGEKIGRYVQVKVNMIEEPDTTDITEFLTISDITDFMISERILHRLAITSFDYVVDLDLARDRYATLSCNKNICCLPPHQGSHAAWTQNVIHTLVVPKDRESYQTAMDPARMLARLREEGSYSFTFSLTDEKGDIQTKRMIVSPIDLRLERVCLSRTDITDSVRAQQGMLNMMTYTFERIGFINLSSSQFTTYTRQTVRNNLSPYVVTSYQDAIDDVVRRYGTGGDEDEVRNQFCLDTLRRRLEEKPAGYDFALPYRTEEGLRYKQINVLWGNDSRRTICLVRADVTDMLTAERNAKNALENALALAEEANRAKSDFLSAMSHDIRTPMNAIMGMTTLAAAHLEDRQRVADYLEKISLSSRHLLSLINDILDMSKIERSQITLTPARLSLSALMEQLSAMITPQAQEAGLQLEIQSQIVHEHFYGDSLHITQILINILSNAVKFTPEGGRVAFTAEEIPASQGPQRVRYRFVIRDTGIGMSQEFLPRIFEPFARSRTAAQIEGTGLGLSITKGLVDLMEGDIVVESQPCQGSVFQVELEFETAPGAEAGERTGAGAQTDQDDLFRDCYFLIAEDNAINAEILSELLKLYGGRAVIKTDGAQAVQAFRNASPGTYDAILMDIQMPEMNGYDATRAIRALNHADAQSIPIIAMTANAFSEDVQAALDAGMSAHVAKPIDVKILRSTLYQALHGDPNCGA